MKSGNVILIRIGELEKLKESLENKDYSKLNLEKTKQQEIKRINIIINTLRWVLG
jgi:hypothetical protein